MLDKNTDVTKLIVGVLAIVIQAITLYNYFMSSVDEVRNEVRVLEKKLVDFDRVLLERSKYVDLADKIENTLSVQEKEIIDINYSLLEHFRKIRQLEEEIDRLQQTYK